MNNKQTNTQEIENIYIRWLIFFSPEIFIVNLFFVHLLEFIKIHGILHEISLSLSCFYFSITNFTLTYIYIVFIITYIKYLSLIPTWKVPILKIYIVNKKRINFKKDKSFFIINFRLETNL